MTKPNFYESEVCVSRRHCDTCRARHAGRVWRGTLRKAFRLPGVDFDCPKSKAWVEDRSTTDANDSPLPKPCGGCAPHPASRPMGSLPLRGSGSDLRPSLASGCGKTLQAPPSGLPIYNVKESTAATEANAATTNDGQPANTQRNPMWDAASPPLYGETRPSCMECIEKHLGAAMVLLSETKNGYPYYLLAVGHLHEAEEESQAWPELAAAIRAVRKELQTTGTLPDLEAIMVPLKQARLALSAWRLGNLSGISLP